LQGNFDFSNDLRMSWWQYKNASEPTARQTCGGQIFLVIFCGAVLVFTVCMEVHFVGVLIDQYQAQSFPKTEGQVLSVRINIQRGSKGGVSYHPAFLYRYEVNGQSYEGGRYRYDGFPTDYYSVNEIVTEHPAGSKIAVYYNPDDPADTVLSPGVVSWDVPLPFLISPFFYIFLFLSLNAWRVINWPGGVQPVAGGVKIMTGMLTTRVRLPRYLPSNVGIITAGILTFSAGIVIEVYYASSTVPAGFFALLIIIVASALAYCWQYWRVASGRQDLVIDEGARTVELPLTYDRSERRPLPFSEIKAVTLEGVTHKVKNGIIYTYAPTLELRDGSTEQLTDIGSIFSTSALNQNRAESFAAWLREKLGVATSEISFMNAATLVDPGDRHFAGQ
jgi:hypothetical protein